MFAMFLRRLAFVGLVLMLILSGLGLIDGAQEIPLVTAAQAARMPATIPVGNAATAPHRFAINFDEFEPDGDFWPPDQFRKDNASITLFLDVNGVAKLCGVPAADHKSILGCAITAKDKVPIVVLPNPCLMQKDDFYAAIACHELAHINGWTHPDIPRAAQPSPPDPDLDPRTIALLSKGIRP